MNEDLKIVGKIWMKAGLQFGVVTSGRHGFYRIDLRALHGLSFQNQGQLHGSRDGAAANAATGLGIRRSVLPQGTVA